ncbi:MAG TPA: asparaginase [Nocardioides sp.]|nr:asparaginase [Nocardioides sp.]
MTARVSAFFLGGTIGMTGHEGGVVSRLTASDLVASVPGLDGLDVELDPHNFRSLPSASLSFDDVVELVATAGAVDADGIVVVQGTDTLEETAYLIDLLWPHDTPVVVTGAMRNPSMAGPDGAANLLAAVQVAAGTDFRGLGALVAFNDQIHAARFVRKTHSTSTAAFASPNAGPIGLMVEGHAVRLTSVGRRPVHRPRRTPDATVPVYAVCLDDDGWAVSRASEGLDGLVVAGLGVGHVPERLGSVLVDLAAEIPVVLTSRTGAGPVLSHTYGFAGSETFLLDGGLVSGGLLDPYKARVLLKVALACDYGSQEIRTAFAAASGLS